MGPGAGGSRRMITLLLALAGLVGLSLLILSWRDVAGAQDRLLRVNDWAKLLQAAFAIGALVLAGYWYFVERRGMPHADVTQTVHVVPVSPGLVAVEAHISVKNLGERLLQVRGIKSRLQRVEAASYDYAQLAGQSGQAYWKAKRPNSPKDAQFHDTELRWPIHEQYEGPIDHDVEPGETDLIVVTFLFRCRAADNIRLATDIISPSEDRKEEELAWKARSFADVADACKAKEGEGP